MLIMCNMGALISASRTHLKGLVSTLSPPNQSLSKQSEKFEKCPSCCTDCVQYEGPNFSIENAPDWPHISLIPPPNEPLSEHWEGVKKWTFEEEEESSEDLEWAILSFCCHTRSWIPNGNNWNTGGIGQGVSPVEGRCKLSRWGVEQNCTTEEEEEWSSKSSKLQHPGAAWFNEWMMLLAWEGTITGWILLDFQIPGGLGVKMIAMVMEKDWARATQTHLSLLPQVRPWPFFWDAPGQNPTLNLMRGELCQLWSSLKGVLNPETTKQCSWGHSQCWQTSPQMWSSMSFFGLTSWEWLESWTCIWTQAFKTLGKVHPWWFLKFKGVVWVTPADFGSGSSPLLGLGNFLCTIMASQNGIFLMMKTSHSIFNLCSCPIARATISQQAMLSKLCLAQQWRNVLRLWNFPPLNFWAHCMLLAETA